MITHGHYLMCKGIAAQLASRQVPSLFLKHAAPIALAIEQMALPCFRQHAMRCRCQQSWSSWMWLLAARH